MSLILSEKYTEIKNAYYLYFSNRLLKIYPVYWVILTLTIFVSAINSSSEPTRLTPYLEYVGSMELDSFLFLIFSNVFILFQDFFLFLGLNLSTGHLFFTSNFLETTPRLHLFLLVPQAWSVSLELIFYLTAPFIVKFRIRYLLLIMLLSILIRFYLSQYGLKNDPWSYRFFPSELVYFIAGMISYKYSSKLTTTRMQKGMSYLLLAYLFAFALFYQSVSFPLKSFLFLFSLSLAIPSIFQLTRSNRIDAWFGDLSYPIYISHIFILLCFQIFHIPVLVNHGFSIAFVTILFSILLDQCIVKRIDRFRQRRVNSASS